jgi:hypothetical protein
LLAIVYFIISSASFKIDKGRNILIVGDSHTEQAIDDTIFSRSINISDSGTAYLYSYIKLRKFFDVNSHIETVIVSFHGESIKKSRDEWILDDKYILGHIPNYISLLRAEEIPVFPNKFILYSAIIKTPIKQIRAILKFAIKRSLSYKDLYIGGSMSTG